MKRRQFLKAFGFGLASVAMPRYAGASGRSGGKGLSKKPNIIFIMADDLGYGHLGCYGQKYIKTPNIDRMAAEGMRFTEHYAGSSVCAPSRCVLMTGLHSGHAYIRNNSEVQPEGQLPIPPETVTVAEVLKKAGYMTMIAGDGFRAGVLLESFSPDIITLDLKLPGVDGFGVLKYVRETEHLKDTKILVISALSEGELKKALYSGAEDVISKPFDKKDLTDKVASLVESGKGK